MPDLTFTYDTFGRLQAVTDYAGTEQFGYDKANRLLADERNFSSGSQFTTYYSVDANGNRYVEELEAGSAQLGPAINRTFDECDHEKTITWSYGSNSGNVDTGITWFPFGGPQAWTWATGFLDTVTEDNAGRITDISLTYNSTKKAEISYSYSNNGNIYAIPTGVATPNVIHDSLSRIVEAPANSGLTSYAYDDRGNRTSQNGTSNSFLSASSDEMSTGPVGVAYTAYDASGNVTTRTLNGTATTSISMNDEGSVGQIGTASGGTVYTRDWQGHKVEMSGAAGSGTWFYRPNGDIFAWIGPTTQSSSYCAHVLNRYYYPSITNYETYVTLGGFRVATVYSYSTTYPGACGGGTTFTITGPRGIFMDRQNVPLGVFDPPPALTVHWNADFDPNGNPLWINDDYQHSGLHLWVPFREPGVVALTAAEGGPTYTPTSGAGGLHENWHRVYDSTTGRYLEPDPAALLPQLDSQELDTTIFNIKPSSLADLDSLKVAAYAIAKPDGIDLVYGYSSESPLSWYDDDGSGVKNAAFGAIGGGAIGAGIGGFGGAAIGGTVALPTGELAGPFTIPAFSGAGAADLGGLGAAVGFAVGAAIPDSWTPGDDLFGQIAGPVAAACSIAGAIINPKKPSDCAKVSASQNECYDCCNAVFSAHGKFGPCIQACAASGLPGGPPRKGKWPW